MVNMEVTLDYIIRRTVNKIPHKTAIIYEDRRISYQELDERANRLANALISLGLQKGDRVGVLLYNCPEYFECIIGITRAGGIMIPLNYRFRSSELEYVLNQGGATFLIYDEEFHPIVDPEKIDTKVEHYVCVGEAQGGNYEHLLSRASAERPSVSLTEDDTSMILNSSGTTGNPKGVCLTHKCQVWNSVNLTYGLDWLPQDTMLIPTPLFHTAALNRSIPVLSIGGTLVLMRQFRPLMFLELLEREKVSITGLVPTMFTMVKQLPDHDGYDVGTVKEVTIGAATVPMALLKQVCVFFPNAKVWNGYGLTECPSATSMRVDQFPPQMNSIGKPYLNLEVRIMDENRREVPVGTIGEICLRGPIVMKQYFNNEEATRDAFSGEWLRTGDLGKVDEDGFVYIMDRKKDMIISGGENIYSKEVEDVLYNHESILEAAVIGVEDELWGESVRAVIQPKPGATLTEEDVIAFCAGRLAGYKKPKSVVFVDDMPKTASNKILKRELREKYGTI